MQVETVVCIHLLIAVGIIVRLYKSKILLKQSFQLLKSFEPSYKLPEMLADMMQI